MAVDNLVSYDVAKQEDNYRAQVQLLSLKFDCRNKGLFFFKKNNYGLGYC